MLFFRLVLSLIALVILAMLGFKIETNPFLSKIAKIIFGLFFGLMGLALLYMLLLAPMIF